MATRWPDEAPHDGEFDFQWSAELANIEAKFKEDEAKAATALAEAKRRLEEATNDKIKLYSTEDAIWVAKKVDERLIDVAVTALRESQVAQEKLLQADFTQKSKERREGYKQAKVDHFKRHKEHFLLVAQAQKAVCTTIFLRLYLASR
jgi:penicillin-binding protein-related factor A (putative recombinase)